MRSHVFAAGPNNGVSAAASPWQQQLVPTRGLTAYGSPRAWSHGLGHLKPVPMRGLGLSPHRALGKQPPPPGVCCQRDARGNTICSDGRGYPPG